MELNELVTSLEAEKKKYIEMINDINCEKICLDQMLVDSLKNMLNIKKTVVQKDQEIIKLQNEIETLKKKIHELTPEINDIIIE